MEPNYTKLEALKVEDAFLKPELLVYAVRETCPAPKFTNGDGLQIGVLYDNVITNKIYDLADYVSSQPLSSFLDFETGLQVIFQKGTLKMMSESAFFQKHLLYETNSSKEIDEEFEADFLAELEKLQNSEDEQKKQHLQSVPIHLKVSIRHALAILNPKLGQEIQKAGIEFDKKTAKKLQSENLT